MSGDDDPLAGVTVPVSGAVVPGSDTPSHLQQVLADLVSRQLPAGTDEPALRTAADHQQLIKANAARTDGHDRKAEE